MMYLQSRLRASTIDKIIFQGITCEDIRDAMKRFKSGFLGWRFFENQTIVHLVAYFGKDPNVLRYLLGFSPDVNLVETVENSQNVRPEFRPVFEAYRNNQWKHPADVLERPFDDNNGKKDNVADAPLGKPLFRGNLFEKKVLGVLGTMILSALVYRYYRTKHKNHIAAAA